MNKMLDQIDSKLWVEIVDYCKLNKIDDINKFLNDTLKMGFTMQKYGLPTQSKIKVEPEKSKTTTEKKKDIYDE